MFNKLTRELKRLEKGTQLEVEVPVDDKQCLDRQCPSDACSAMFKVHVDDWKEKVSDERAFCPLCGLEAPGSDWNTPEQVAYFTKVAVGHAQKALGDAIRGDVKRFNRRQLGGFVQMSMSYRPGLPPIAIPSAALEELRQDLVCEACECRHSTLGPAFFCPACGHNSPASTFSQSLAFARRTAEAAEAIEATVAAEFDPDTARGSVRQMLEGALVRLVGAFQPYAESLFAQHPGSAGMKFRKGAFQNLDEGSKLWRKATGHGYEDHLDATQIAELTVYFQRRHLLAHREGIVDQEYIDKSGDSTYSVGQRLVVDSGPVTRLASLLSALAEELVKS